jgi:hypothetical protein
MSALRVNSGTAIASGEEVRAALRELHKRAALMQRQPATLDRQIQAPNAAKRHTPLRRRRTLLVAYLT